jgi:tetratricopeptide (TPR) repeat protein
MIEDSKITEKLDWADDLLKQGKYNEARTLLEEIHKLYPEEESVLLRLAWTSWDSGDKERSIQYWEILLDRELQRKVFTGFAYDELVRIYKQDGKTEKLVILCEKAARVQPQDIGLLEELGNAYLLAGRNEKACEAFKKLASMEADNPAFYCRLGEALMATGKTQECEDAYDQAGRIDPDDADRYLFHAADLYLKRGHFNSAKRLLTKCLEIAPSNSLYYCSLGDILVALKEPDDAFTAYETACRYNHPHTAAYFNRLGNSLMKARFFTDAAKAFEAALSFDASTPCRRNLEEAYQAAGQSSNTTSNT